MIVTEDEVAAAVQFMNDHEAAEFTHYQATKAANYAELVYRRIYRSANGGTVADKEAFAICSEEYQEAKEQEAIAAAKLFAHKQRCEGSKMIRDAWQTTSANIRAAETIR